MAKWLDNYHNGVVDASTAITRLIDGIVLDNMAARDRGKFTDFHREEWKYKMLRTIEINVLCELKDKIKPNTMKEELGYGKKG
jgi:hypothetical protein